MSNINDNLTKVNNEIEINKKGLEKINIDEIKTQLEKEINGLLKIEIKIN